MTSGSGRVARWINPVIRSMQAYHVPDASGLIKLDAMENPYHLPDTTRTAWLKALGHAAINRYPDPGAGALKSSIRRVLSVPDSQGVILGNGSDEIIQMIIMAVAAKDRCVLAPEPGFVMYRVIAEILGLEYAGVPLDPDFNLDMAAMLAAIDLHQPAVIFMATPNNPTGNRFDRDAVLQIVEAAPGLVVIDEAYFIFTDDSFMQDLECFEHLLVMRTLSKLGLAGLRVGFLAGPQAWLQEFDKLRLPYNINVLSQLSAEFFLEHYHPLQEQAARIVQDREEMYAALGNLAGIEVFPSEANFLLIRCRDHPADEVHQALREQGILVKNLHGSQAQLDQCLRVTVGSAVENRTFLDALSGILAGNS
ncbi:MAG: histidinol-phosphate transaminase [Gammaproteobacteria bacterium]|nr:histidinol-phosphate transaminase [Gammaproteobacteria bacterium]